jgi:hypothetical protein
MTNQGERDTCKEFLTEHADVRDPKILSFFRDAFSRSDAAYTKQLRHTPTRNMSYLSRFRLG